MSPNSPLTAAGVQLAVVLADSAQAGSSEHWGIVGVFTVWLGAS